MGGWYMIVIDSRGGQADVLVRLETGGFELLHRIVNPSAAIWTPRKPKKLMCWPTKSKAANRANQFNMEVQSDGRLRWQLAKAVSQEELDLLMVTEVLAR